MTPIKVLQVFTILNRGGAETNLMNYYRRIDRAVVQFDFLVHRQEEGAYEQEIKKLGGQIFRLPALHPGHIKKYKAAIRIFFDSHPNYHIIHGQCSELGIFIYQEAKKRNVPVIIAHAHSSRMSWDYKAIFRLTWKFQMRKYINAYFTCGAAASDYLFGKDLSYKTFQVNNAVDGLKLSYSVDIRNSVRQDLNSTLNFNMIHVGSFNKIKNHRFIIEVFSEIIKINPVSKLFLVGDGPLKQEIESFVTELKLSESVFFLGTRNDVPDLLQAMDVFLFPSFYEGLPLSLVEAQSSGILCAISDTIPAEAILVSENVKVLGLKKSAKFWAEEIIHESSGFTRTDVNQIIKDAGYDINDNVIKLEEKYLELYKQFS